MGASARRGLLGARRGFYAAPRDQPRVRRATDIAGLVASLLALAGVIAAQPPGPLERSFLRFLQAFPPWLGPIWQSLIGLLVAWVAMLLVVPLVSGRPRVVLEALLAVVVAGLLGLLAARIATGDWPGGQAVTGLSPRLHFPGIRLAMAAAVICVVNGNLTRPIAADRPPRAGAGRCRRAAGRRHDRRRHRGRSAGGPRCGCGRASGARHLCGSPDDRRRRSLTRGSRRRRPRPPAGRTADRRGAPRAWPGTGWGSAHDQGLWSRRLRQPDARAVLARNLVPRRGVIGRRPQPLARRRAGGAADAACAQRRGSGSRGGDGRRDGPRRFPPGSARLGHVARVAERPARSTTRFCGRAGRPSRDSGMRTSRTGTSARRRCASTGLPGRRPSSSSAAARSRRPATTA